MLSATWRRCRVHFMRTALAHAGKQSRGVAAGHDQTYTEHIFDGNGSGRGFDRFAPIPSQSDVAAPVPP